MPRGWGGLHCGGGFVGGGWSGALRPFLPRPFHRTPELGRKPGIQSLVAICWMLVDQEEPKAGGGFSLRPHPCSRVLQDMDRGVPDLMTD